MISKMDDLKSLMSSLQKVQEMLGELDKSKQELMLQWHLKCKTLQMPGELSSLWPHGDLLTILRLRHGEDLQIKMGVRLKIDPEARDALNVALKAICPESVLMEMEVSLERELVSSVETKVICLENAPMATMEISLEVEAVSNVEERAIELKIAQGSKQMLNLKMKKDLEEEDASNAEMKVIEQENVLEKEEINHLKNKDKDEVERMRIQT